MKLGGFEGTSQEFDDVIKNHGFRPEQFLDTKNHNIPKWGLFVALLIFTVVVFFLYITKDRPNVYIGLFIVSLITLGIICCIIQLKYRELTATILCFTVGGILLGVSVGNLTPKQAAKKVMDLKIDKTQ